jgi:hypothetical protein
LVFNFDPGRFVHTEKYRMGNKSSGLWRFLAGVGQFFGNVGHWLGHMSVALPFY